MFESTRSITLVLARIGAVAFALSAGCYLVVTAQRRANPQATTTIVEASSSEPAVAGETFLQGSKSLVLEPTEVVAGEDSNAVVDSAVGPVLLSTSKTLNWTPHSNLPALVYPPISASTEAPAQTTNEFLPSSKVGVITTTVAEPAAEPVFLPSSKVKTQLNPLRPVLVPGTMSTTEHVFMPSSKSLRLEVSKPPAAKPAPAPVEPPKNR